LQRGHPSPLYRYKLFSEALAAIEAQGGGLDRFSRGWEYFGFNRTVVSGSWSLSRTRPQPPHPAQQRLRAAPGVLVVGSAVWK